MHWSWQDEQDTPLSIIDEVAEMIHAENREREKR
jgi:hypothetical protein